MTAPGALVQSLRARSLEVLAPLIDPKRPIALVDFPNHSNVGDSAIWSGELALLRAIGVEQPAYVCFGETYYRPRMARAIGRDGIILLHGGGNFGDLWPWHQKLRELVIQDFPDHEIIQLPQTMYFEDPVKLERTRAVLDAHPRLTLVVRAQDGLEFARREFRARSLLAPDSAFHINLPPLDVEPDVDILWLSRTDRETAGREVVRAPDILRLDWLDDDPSLALALDRSLRTMMYVLPRPARGTLSGVWSPPFCESLAWGRVVRGLRLLRRGRVVITDRLHGHILCELLGIPHVILANKYHKIRRFWDTWTSGSTLANWADDERDAVALARRLAMSSGGTVPG